MRISIIASPWNWFTIKDNKYQIYLFILNKFSCVDNFLNYEKGHFSNHVDKIDFTKFSKPEKRIEIVYLNTIK